MAPVSAPRPFLGNGVLMTTTLTGLAYNDVVVQGGFVPVRLSGEQSAGASRSRLDARRRHPRVELRFWERVELVRARRCLRGSAPVRRWRQSSRPVPVVRGSSPGASCLTSLGLCPHCAAFARNGGWHSGDCGPRTRDPAWLELPRRWLHSAWLFPTGQDRRSPRRQTEPDALHRKPLPIKQG